MLRRQIMVLQARAPKHSLQMVQGAIGIDGDFFPAQAQSLLHKIMIFIIIFLVARSTRRCFSITSEKFSDREKWCQSHNWYSTFGTLQKFSFLFSKIFEWKLISIQRPLYFEHNNGCTTRIEMGRIEIENWLTLIWYFDLVNKLTLGCAVIYHYIFIPLLVYVHFTLFRVIEKYHLVDLATRKDTIKTTMLWSKDCGGAGKKFPSIPIALCNQTVTVLTQNP